MGFHERVTIWRHCVVFMSIIAIFDNCNVQVKVQVLYCLAMERMVWDSGTDPRFEMTWNGKNFE